MLLTLNATSWMAIIYAIKEGWTIGKIPSHLFGILLLIIPVFLSWLSLALSRFLGAESPVVNCKEFNLADGEFLPIYLGYFFVSVGVSEHFTMAVVYLIVFVFTFQPRSRFRSIVRSCSNRSREVGASPGTFSSRIWVGRLFFAFLLVMAAATTVGLK